MATFNATFLDDSNLNASFSETGSLSAQFGSMTVRGNNLFVASTAEWDAQRDKIAEKNVVYVYTDRTHDDFGNPIPGYKVGDGFAYLIDLPFNDDMYLEHINDEVIHISDEEREFWNNKVTAYIDATDIEILVLTKD